MSNVRARTIRPDGSIVNFDGKVYESAIVKGQGVKYLAKTFTMPDVCVGGIIEYRFNYDFSNKWVVETNWELSGDLFTRRAKFSLKPSASVQVRCCGSIRGDYRRVHNLRSRAPTMFSE